MSLRRCPIQVGRVLLLVVVASAVVASTAGATRSPRPVIGKPVTAPVRPMAGKPFSVAFRVTRGDTGARLSFGRMVCDPSVSGRVIRHAESFRNGLARLAFVIPASAGGKLLKVKVTIRAAGVSATRVARFNVLTPKAMMSIGDLSAAEGTGGTTTFSVPVTLAAPSPVSVSAHFATSDGAATAPADYVTGSGTVAFAPGQKVKMVTVAVVADSVVEPNETFTVSLSNPVNAVLADASATVTITNDDVAAMSIGDVSAAEGTGGTTTVSVPVTLSTTSTLTVSVGFATSNGSATAPADYATTSGTLTFAPGEKAKTVAVAVVADSLYESNETFTVSLSNPVNATLADASATVTITNDDAAVRTGHYSGTTSQGYSIGFDVSNGLTSVSSFGLLYFDVTCTEAPGTFRNNWVSTTGSISLAADWSFGSTTTYTDTSGSATLTLNGKLAAPGVRAERCAST